MSNAHRLGGHIIRQESSFADCITQCQRDGYCMGVDWVRASGECWAHDSLVSEETGDPTDTIDNNCCIHWYKMCPDDEADVNGGVVDKNDNDTKDDNNNDDDENKIEGKDDTKTENCPIVFLENTHIPGGSRYDGELFY